MKLSKKILSLMMAVAIGVSSMSMMANARGHEVKTAVELKENLTLNENITLCNDINMSGVDMDCLKSIRYTKTFDGKGHTIKNMTTPLAEFMNGATVRNVTLYNTRAEHGAVAEKIYDNTLIENVTVKDGRITGKDNLGAITGASRRSKIINCKNNETEVRNEYNGRYCFEGNTGGIVGYMKDTTVKDCTNDEEIYSMNENLGGIVGKGSNSTVINCWNSGRVTHNLGNPITGGIMGLATYTKLTNCLNTGTVKKGKPIRDISGGIVGRCGESRVDSDDYAEIQTCFDASRRDVSHFNPIYGKNWKNARAYDCAYLCTYSDKNRDDDAPGKRFNLDKVGFVSYVHGEVAKLNANNRNKSTEYRVWSEDELTSNY